VIEIRQMELTKRSFHEVARLLKECFPSARHLSAAYLEWDYAQNPAGDAIAFNAYDGELLVAHFGAQPIEAHLRGSKEKGLVTQNAATHSDYRGRKLFFELAQRTMEEAASAAYGFALALANASSVHGFTQSLGYQRLRPLDVKIGVGASPAAGEGESDFRRLWDVPALVWRLSCPTLGYAKRVQEGRTTVYAPSRILGVWVELGTFPAEWIPPEVPELRSWNPVRVWMGFDAERDWKRSAYTDLPVRLRPAPLHFTIRDLSGRARVFQAEEIHFRGLDFDAY
jgi:GNAT superfamily N-acetyltransferase